MTRSGVDRQQPVPLLVDHSSESPSGLTAAARPGSGGVNERSEEVLPPCTSDHLSGRVNMSAVVPVQCEI